MSRTRCAVELVAQVLDQHVGLRPWGIHFRHGRREQQVGAKLLQQRSIAFHGARMILRSARSAEENWMTNMVNKDVLVIAEFPPHLLEWMLRSGIKITQIHPPTPEGDMPAHFYHLARRGLRGVIDFRGITEATVEMMLFEGVRHADLVYVSPLVPVTIRMFPNVANRDRSTGPRTCRWRSPTRASRVS